MRGFMMRFDLPGDMTLDAVDNIENECNGSGVVTDRTRHIIVVKLEAENDWDLRGEVDSLKDAVNAYWPGLSPAIERGPYDVEAT